MTHRTKPQGSVDHDQRIQTATQDLLHAIADSADDQGHAQAAFTAGLIAGFLNAIADGHAKLAAKETDNA